MMASMSCLLTPSSASRHRVPVDFSCPNRSHFPASWHACRVFIGCTHHRSRHLVGGHVVLHSCNNPFPQTRVLLRAPLSCVHLINLPRLQAGSARGPKLDLVSGSEWALVGGGRGLSFVSLCRRNVLRFLTAGVSKGALSCFVQHSVGSDQRVTPVPVISSQPEAASAMCILKKIESSQTRCLET